MRRVLGAVRDMLAPRRMAAPKKAPTRILITRHGQTVTNTEGRFCGHAETELTDRGRAQAKALGLRLAPIELHAIYTSGLSRAVLTAHLATEDRGVPVAVDPDLRELHYGEWELEKGTVVARRYREQHQLMRAEDPAWHPPGGENILQVRARTMAALQRIVRKHKNETTLIVSHGTAINCMLGEVLGIAPTHNFRFGVANCSLSEVVVERGRFYVRYLNDTSHLAGIESPVES